MCPVRGERGLWGRSWVGTLVSWWSLVAGTGADDNAKVPPGEPGSHLRGPGRPPSPQPRDCPRPGVGPARLPAPNDPTAAVGNPVLRRLVRATARSSAPRAPRPRSEGRAYG